MSVRVVRKKGGGDGTTVPGSLDWCHRGCREHGRGNTREQLTVAVKRGGGFEGGDRPGRASARRSFRASDLEAVRNGGFADRLFWSRHANPASVWSLVLAFPTLIVALYRRSVPLAAGTLLLVAANPILLSPPEVDDAWATRVVLGERVWVEEGVWPSADAVFAAACAPVYLYTIRSAVRRRPLSTTAGTVVSLVLMLVFFGRMVRRYESRAER